MLITVREGDGHCGRSVKEVLGGLCLSSKMIKYLKYKDDGITVNGERVTVRYILRPGDVLSLAVNDREASAAALPNELPISVVYEDDDLIVVNKPPFMPTHPSHGHHDDTLANALAFYFEKKDYPFVFRPINRLDKNTSGLSLTAKHKIAAGILTDEMLSHEIKKTYIAILEGRLEPDGDAVIKDGKTLYVIDRPIHRTAKSIIVREVCDASLPDAEEAVTYYRIVKRCDDCTVVKVFPLTGRTHQIRVHFASLGHPLFGDDLYGRESDLINRHALHASRLEFILPSSREKVEFSASLPADMAALGEHFFKDGINDE